MLILSELRDEPQVCSESSGRSVALMKDVPLRHVTFPRLAVL